MKNYNHNLFHPRSLANRFLSTITLVCLAAVAPVSAQSSRNVTIRVQNASVRAALDKLQKSARMHCMYEDETIDNPPRKITLEYDNAPLSVVLDDLGAQALLDYEVKENIILLFPQRNPAKAKQKESAVNLSGKVVDEYGIELPGVTVMIDGTTKGTTTDINGRYDIEVAPGNALLFSYVGMENKRVKVHPGKRIVNVEMTSSQTALGEVIVTGYQTLSKERATGAYSVISGKNTKGKLQTNIMSRIEGMAAGMNKMNSSDSNDKVIVRGVTTYQGQTNPLYVVDGLPFEGEIASINPSDVQNITILKDAAAASIYGARSANGVIVITTKHGQAGATRINYTGNTIITPKPDLEYLGLMNSSELVDMQIEGFNFYHLDYANLNKRKAVNPVIDILYRHERGEIKNLEQALSPYRNNSNRRQLEKEFARTAVTSQHNLSVSGGTERSRYIASVNYMKGLSNLKNEYSERIGFNLKNNAKFFEWLFADFGASGSFSKTDDKNSRRAGGNYPGLILAYPSYYMLYDADGTLLPWQREKSEYELERLRNLGLMDETYSPVTDKAKEHLRTNTNYYRIQAGLLFRINENLNANLKYQTEGTYAKKSLLFDAQSWTIRNMVNNAAIYNKEKKELTLNVPKGAWLDETRGDSYAYTFRAQINFDKTSGIHDIHAIAGAERRLRRDTETNTFLLGFDPNALSYTPYDPKLLSMLFGTESLYGYSVMPMPNKPVHGEDRYVSFYGNASYTHDERYSITGSMRIDKTNLYAIKSRTQNKPLWSVGGSWHITKEKFMAAAGWVNLLSLRATYGIGGNIPKTAGPYINIKEDGYNNWVNGIGSYVQNPSNPKLRWEKTATANIGLDFALFDNRLNGSLNYYVRKSTDLLGYRNMDATLGWSSLLINYGTMSNKGVEVELQTANIRSRNFNWTTHFVFSYNKNRLTDLSGTSESVYNYSAFPVAAVGYPLNSLFSYRYAGLDPENGNVMVYNKKGEKVTDVESVDDLVYSGTRIPPRTASITNTFSYRNFDLSFMFIYYGGHVMRDVVADYADGAPDHNLNRKSLNHWRKPGDEKIPGVAPSFNRNINFVKAMNWYAADTHIRKADYIKLEDISLSYNVPNKWLSKSKMKSLVLTCQIGNLWWWAQNGSINPEAAPASNYGAAALAWPVPATYAFGLSVDF